MSMDRCAWQFSGAFCSSDGVESPELFLMVSHPPPRHCFTRQPLPRCERELNYVIISSKAQKYTCTDGGENSGNVFDSLQFVRFHGRQCGYDLIQWEAASILRQQDVSSSSTQSCEIKENSQSLSCGEVPAGESLPGENPWRTPWWMKTFPVRFVCLLLWFWSLLKAFITSWSGGCSYIQPPAVFSILEKLEVQGTNTIQIDKKKSALSSSSRMVCVT